MNIDIMPSLVTIVGLFFGCGGGLLAIGVSGFFIYRMIKGNTQTSNLIANGVSAPGTIISVQHTGWRINGRPQARLTIQINPSDRPAFMAVVTRAFNPSMVSGLPVQVRFDPNDITKVAIESLGSDIGLAQMGPAPIDPNLKSALLAQDRYNEQLMITGVEARAVIVTITNTNIRNENVSWVYHLTFDVITPTGEHFQSETNAAIADFSLYKYQPSKLVIVRYDPNNKSQVALVKAVEG